jgi:predicted RNA-binding Zn ribbon-like protein
MAENNNEHNFFLIANNLSLDFINTEYVENGEPKDALTGYADLLAWAVAVNLLESPQRTILLQELGNLNAADEIFTKALKFRSKLRTMVEELEKRIKPSPQILSEINEILSLQTGYTELIPTEDGFRKRFRNDFRDPGSLLSPIAEAAADLLCYGNPVYLKKCENPDCVLHFYDTSKNHKRRWCSMNACGNRAKAAAFYQRQRKKSNALPK